MKILIASSMLVLMLFTTTACANSNSDSDPELVTPEHTVLSYCRKNIFDLRSKYFNYPEKILRNSRVSSLNWSKCKIVSAKKTKLIGEDVEGGVVQPGDVEIILSVKEKDSDNTDIKTRYWFLLGKFSLGWKIISYSLISADTLD